MFKRLSASLLILAIGASASVTASAQSDLVAARKANFKQTGIAMRQMRGQFSGGDYEAIAASALKIAAWAEQMPEFFPAGTGPDKHQTDALPSIWERFDSFTALAQDNQKAALSLANAAKDGDGNSIMAGMQDLGKTCGACHSQFRK